MKLEKVAVFLGSNFGKSDIYIDAVKKVADCLAKNNLELIYGGAKNGLMGELATYALEKGVKVTGVIPKDLIKSEIHHKGITKLHEVNSMHDRKELMSNIADAFIVCAGGCGSLDEFFEIYTWAQLNFHTRPIAILNTNDYYKHVLAQLDHMVEEQFVRPEHRDMLIVSKDPEEIIEKFRKYKHPVIDKWIPDSRQK
ncbi:MAG: TIGR00730 family Rossman fold protein [Rickettsiales bacterium]